MARVRAGLLSLRDLLATAWPIILIVSIGFAVAYQFVEPAPPRHISISSGGESGAYYSFAKRYAELLEKNGIELEVKTSQGSQENLQRLKKGEADIALIQGGIVAPPVGDDEPELLSLGSMFYEPVWVFYRGEKTLDKLHQLAGKRIAVGAEGSGIRGLALQLLELNDIPTDGKHRSEERRVGKECRL